MIRAKLAVASVILGGIIGSASAQTVGEADASFVSGSRINGNVQAIAPLADGRFYVGGEFTTAVGAVRNYVARLQVDGTVDPAFDTGSGANNQVEILVVQPDGKVIIGGWFTQYDGTPRNRIARILPDGNIDTTFDPGTGFNGVVASLALQADGKVIVGGYFTSCNGTPRNYIARLNANGSLDAGFDPGGGASGAVRAVAVQPDGKVLIGGHFTTFVGVGRNHLARLNADATLDTGFVTGAGSDAPVTCLALQADGKVLVGGTFTTYDGTSRSRIVRTEANGSLDASFNPGGGTNAEVSALAVQGDGRIVIGGWFTNFNGNPRGHVARLEPGGAIDTGFDPGTGAQSLVFAIAVQSNGKVLVGGQFKGFDGTPRNHVARLLPDGSVDATLLPDTGADSRITSMARQRDGKIVVVGEFASFDGVARQRIARIGVNGVLDPVFDPGSGADEAINAVAVDSEGRILIAGDFSNFDGSARQRIARLLPDGGIDPSFDPGGGANGVVTCMVIQPDGNVLIGGDFTSYNGVTRQRIARITATGSLDPSFDPGIGGNARVACMALQSDGKLLIGGDFTGYAGTLRDRIARLNVDGSHDLSFDPGVGANDLVACLAVQADGKILAAGNFTGFDLDPHGRIVRLESNGSLDTGFNAGGGINGIVNTLALQANGRFLLGGGFTTINGTPRENIARFKSDGSLDIGFDPGEGTNGVVDALVLQPDGKVLISGDFTTYHGAGAGFLVRAVLDPATLSLVAPAVNQVRWLVGGTASELEQVIFERSVDGMAWLPLGLPDRIAGGWELDGANLGASGFLRARARIPGGNANGSSSTIEQVSEYYFPPEISVESPPGTVLPFGNAAAGFGTVPFGGNSEVVFTIRNLGVDNLLPGEIVFAGDDPGDFTVTDQPDGSVASNTTTTFTVTFDPSSPGAKSAVLRIPSNDADRDPFEIALTGTMLKGVQSIVFEPVTTQVATDTVALTATGGASGNPVTFTVDGPAELSGNILSFTAAGMVTVTANQAGNANYDAASPVQRIFTVTAKLATVTMSNLSQTYDGNPKNPSATTVPPGLPVGFDYGGPAPVNAGTHPVTATVTDPRYVGSDRGDLVIAKASQTISFPAINNRVATEEVTLIATGGGSGNPVVFSVVGAAQIAGNSLLTFTGPGQVTVKANQAGGANHEAAPEVSQTFDVEAQTAEVVLTRLHQVADGTGREVVVTTTPADLPVNVTYDGLPAIPTAVGSYNVSANITDARYEGSANGTLIVDDPARLLSVAGGSLPALSALGALVVPTFQTGAYEVTGSQWSSIVLWAESERGYDFAPGGTALEGDHPITGVSWYEAAKWCNARTEWENAQSGRSLAPAYRLGGVVYRTGTPASPGDLSCDFGTSGYRLPTAAEWEYAARGGAGGGSSLYAGGNSIEPLAWYVGNSNGTPRPAGGKLANLIGLYDGSGNAAEWVWDAPSGSPAERLLRGGAWSSSAAACEVATLTGESPGTGLDRSGFRLSRSVSLALAGALDTTNLEWETSGDHLWAGETGETHDGEDAAASGEHQPGQSSSLETEVVGPVNLSFRWKTKGVSGQDLLAFSVDGNLVQNRSGLTGWEEVRLELPSGTHPLRWDFSRVSTNGEAAAWLDAVVVEPAQPPVVTTAAATSVSGSAATLGGEISDDGNREVTSRGVVYGSSPNPTLGNAQNLSHGLGGPGAFEVGVSGLQEGTTYHMAAYATNNLGTSYGASKVFTTRTTVAFNDGLASYNRVMLAGDKHHFDFLLDGPRLVSLVSSGGAALRAVVRNSANEVVATFDGDGDFDLEEPLFAGNHSLEIYRLEGNGPAQNYTISIDASLVASTRPDLAVGKKSNALLGGNQFAPIAQSASMISKKAKPVTGYVEFANRGNLPDVISGRVTGKYGLFKVTYSGPGGNVTAGLLSGTFRTPKTDSGAPATLIKASITPNKKKLIKKQGNKTKILKKKLTLNFTATSTFDAGLNDTVSLKVQTK